MHSTYLQAFVKQKLDSKFPLSWRGYNRHCLRTEITTGKGTLLRYISTKARPPNLMDNLLLQPLDLAKKCLLWRTNRSFINRICPACLGKSTRAHINRCQLYKLIEDGESIMESEEFTADSSNSQEKEILHYTILDYFLNRHDYIRFLTLYDRLEDVLNPIYLPPQGV
jgi:hypothetical protein